MRTELTLASSSTSSFPPWTTARFRQELDRVGLELELFGGSFSLSRTLTYLHSLAHRLHSTSRTCTAPTKPVSIHLDAITRQLATSASSSTTPKSAEDLYHEQMALTTKAKNAAYNQAYGAVTSTMSISRQSLEESGMVETEKGAAYRYRNDAVAGGAYVGVGKTGGRSLFDVGQRKLDTARRPLSDTEEELELEEERRASEVEAARAYDAQPQGPLLFYRAPRPIVSEPQKRTIGGAAPSDLLLLRHLPYRSPFDTPLQQDEVTEPSTPSYPTRVDTAIVKRRKRTDDDEADDLLAHFGAIAAPSRPGAPPTRPPKPLRPANPFAAKRKATLPTSAPPPLLRRAELGGPTSSVPPAQQQPQARKLVLARPLPGLAKRR